jgi:hypothetical protein
MTFYSDLSCPKDMDIHSSIIAGMDTTYTTVLSDFIRKYRA